MEKIIGNNSGRNSRMRELIASPGNEIALRLHKTFRHLTANQITVLGGLGAMTTAAYATALIPDDPSLAARVAVLGSYAFFSLFDAVDGRFADLMDKHGIQRDKQKGVLVDVGIDKLQEVALFICHMAIASSMGNREGMYAAGAAALLRPLSALARSYAEERGIFVNEGGRDLKGFWGTRTGSTILGTAALVAPEIGGFNFVKWADLAVASATGLTAIRRYREGNKPELALTKESLDAMSESARQKALFEIAIAPKKERLLRYAMGASIAATSLAYLALK